MALVAESVRGLSILNHTETGIHISVLGFQNRKALGTPPGLRGQQNLQSHDPRLLLLPRRSATKVGASRWILVPLVPSCLPEPVVKNLQTAMNARSRRRLVSDLAREAKPGGGNSEPPQFPRRTAGGPACPTPRGPCPRLRFGGHSGALAPWQAGDVRGFWNVRTLSPPLPAAAGLRCYMSGGNILHYLPSQFN